MCLLYGGRLWFKYSCGTQKKCPLWRGFVIRNSLGIRPVQNFLSALERCPL